ncbi:M48 family metalloprotease [Celeribacter marinus]|uniref:Peptidase, M48 family n=1 Tax=Celeribacter marinus TaxID=1397108 RepID=A0A0P0AA78_9RHOB|nr:M48 family metalloprotease [Celeribacter marinus]ALI55033.1 peptidase, M48 family [Celeribacter marinus]SFK05285.1 Peptidase family M48 [Celeribacter marinus]
MITSRFAIVLSAALGLSGCVTPVTTPPSTPVPAAQSVPQSQTSGVSVSQFAAVVARMEPIAEAECRARAPQANCDYKILVDRRAQEPANAYQSVTDSGQPTITFTVALIADVYNIDELAFVMGHEAAHHIRGHLGRTQETAVAGAVIGSLLGAALGADAQGLQTLQNLGASVGSRTYSKSYELEADQLGTIIAARAGFNPVRGAQYFARIPDPGDQFLGSHPPNAQRIETVKRTMATM